MSSKINVLGIVAGHIKTLKSSGESKLSFQDLFTFFLMPILAAVLGVLLDLKLTDEVTSLLVNFGAIFTALLLSVLVLVYDQGSKISDKIEGGNAAPVVHLKQKLLNELYFNICYSIVLSVSLVFLCLVEKLLRGHPLKIDISKFSLSIDIDLWISAPLVVFVTVHLMLTILMIVKRMHTLLTSN
ncbi:hypothetical protein AAOGI_00240 [Agarivorans albus]